MTFGSLPIIGLGLAFSFAFYGLVRKKIAVDAQTGMLVETLWLLPGGGNLVVRHHRQPDQAIWARNPWSLNLLLMAAGVVTTIPLLWLYPGRQRVCGSPRWAFSSTSAQR
ncbi:protein rarD [Klebsiella pneumoniae subsp. ozaenae]|uniref:Protein rarD n=1 Tax=Klebsiella pneumoniae subsp. ozaenae TaxID=574 RepID=A0A378AQZ3_KLEPO|nr:protein rarD [Klebsiella pneumoniae subsp. ozaenae]